MLILGHRRFGVRVFYRQPPFLEDLACSMPRATQPPSQGSAAVRLVPTSRPLKEREGCVCRVQNMDSFRVMIVYIENFVFPEEHPSTLYGLSYIFLEM